ncbi:unnamed protein product [Hermetia illucens]|uniref:Uncharacterized protein n=1 Tax=Hermetia illucens TaxID=343691 RepID=A0A7R8YY34_HERIL|nr:unnamed protein product [Hermetia illucens]
MGDLTPMQDGRRSKSQISVFDYPEHLNPFYEDENHKRLRFWKIGKKDGTSSRRGSFSLGGLREMWTFKSLRGKKKSSTLGINKTSESPEPLRRTLGQNDNLYATYDPRYRNTYDNGSINNNFQRNVPYRTSLQDMSCNKGSNGNGFGLLRNDNYRSTIQITGRRNNINNSASNTPTVPTRRSSQLSVASSTNPFEDDDDDVTTGRLSSTEGSDRPTPTKRRVRKKRPAPPPPVPVPKSIDEEGNSIPATPTTTKTIILTTAASTDDETSSQDNNFENQLQHQMQRTRDFNEEEKKEISNIAAEIEHYVKLLSEDADDESAIRLIPVTKPVLLQKSKSSTSVPKTASPNQMKKAGSEILSRSEPGKDTPAPTRAEIAIWSEGIANKKNRESMKKIIQIRRDSLMKPIPATRRRPSITSLTSSRSDEAGRRSASPERKSPSPEKKQNNTSPPGDKPTPSARKHSPTEEEMKSRGSPAAEKKAVIANGFLPNQSGQHADEENNNLDHRSASSKEHTPLNSSYDTTTDESIPPAVELKITESREDISDISNTSSERYQIRYVPLKEGSPETPPEVRKDPKPEFKPVNSNHSIPIQHHYNESWVADQEPRRPSVERRRSVKEIIDSINRSQSLLKVNQDPQKPPRASSNLVNDLNGSAESTVTPQKASKSEVEETYRRLSQSEAEIKRMILEMETLTNPNEMNNYCENVPSILDRFDEEVNNNDIFKKCVLKKQLIREGSPTASNLDWNPVPKPKRSKNLRHEEQIEFFGVN